jgi:outer membrane protein TolC
MLLAGLVLAADAPDQPQPIDLATALRLAGAQSLDIKLAQEKLTEARANQTSARAQFFPWLAPGVGYRRHDGNTQAVTGEILDVSKQAYSAGATLAAQLDLGDALNKTLAARQLVKAADHALAVQQQISVLVAAQNYFELAKAQAAVGVAREAVRISQDYEGQLGQAVAAGLALKGEALRVRVQTERNQLALRQAQEQQRIAAARLAQVLRLEATVELQANDGELAPLTLVETNAPLKTLVAQALAARPELKQGAALLEAARAGQNNARYGGLVPSLNAQMFAGGLGGGVGGAWGNFGSSEDYFVGVSWRLGPGGLFDPGRLRAAESQVRSTQILEDKLRDEISRQVVEAATRVQSQVDQLARAKQALATAEESLHLSRQRKEFAIANVLENIQAEQDLTRTRRDYLNAIAEFNKAQYALTYALGRLAAQP